jgi:hypothetical protein
VGAADLFRDPGRPLVNAAGDFRDERSPLEGVPQHGLGVGVLGIREGSLAAVSLLIQSLSPASDGALKPKFEKKRGPRSIQVQ